MKIIERFEHEEIQAFKFGYAPFGKPKLAVHLYFVDGLLIDTGQSKMRRAILHTLKDVGINQIFLSHYHEDHSGNLNALQQQFNCPIYSSERTAQIMKNPPSISLPQHIYWGARPANKSLRVKEEEIQTAHYCFKIIAIPGHAPDMVALYEPEKRWLFSADLYLNSYIGYMLPDESVTDQIKSIKKILKLDFDTLLCAHNPKFKTGKTQLTKKMKFLEGFYEKVATLNQQQYSAKAIMKKLKLKEFRMTKFLSNGNLAAINMVKAVIRDEQINPL